MRSRSLWQAPFTFPLGVLPKSLFRRFLLGSAAFAGLFVLTSRILCVLELTA
jgi:hypothetical protein